MGILSKIKQELLEAKTWALKSWTIHFNTIAGLVAVFADNLASMAGAVKEDIYSWLVLVVPAANFLLRAKTQKQGKKAKEPDELA